MTVNNPSFSGTTTDLSSVQTSFKDSTFISKGGPRPPSNNIEAIAWVAEDSLVPTENSVYKELLLTAEYTGQLFWSVAAGTYPNFVITPASAQLYIAVRYTDYFGALPTVHPKYFWVPVRLDPVVSYLDPATGETWDPLGAYTCNPSYLCA